MGGPIRGQNGDPSIGYGRLTDAQKAEVDKSKSDATKAKEAIRSYIGDVTHVKENVNTQMADVDRLGREVIAYVKGQTSTELTKAQKEILSNAKGNIKNLNKDVDRLKKDEIKDLKQEIKQTDKKLEASDKSIQKYSEKIESKKEDPGFLRSNFLFGESKQSRVDDSKKMADQSIGLADSGYAKVSEVKEKQKVVETKIQDLKSKESLLNKQIETRVSFAKDIHQEIQNAKENYRELLAKYEKRQDVFYGYETTSKMRDNDKEQIKSKLLDLKKQIRSLENLERNVGKEKIDSKVEENFIEGNQSVLKALKESVSSIAADTEKLINQSTFEKMGILDKIKFVVSRLIYSPVKIEENVVDHELESAFKSRDHELESAFKSHDHEFESTFRSYVENMDALWRNKGVLGLNPDVIKEEVSSENAQRPSQEMIQENDIQPEEPISPQQKSRQRPSGGIQRDEGYQALRSNQKPVDESVLQSEEPEKEQDSIKENPLEDTSKPEAMKKGVPPPPPGPMKPKEKPQSTEDSKKTSSQPTDLLSEIEKGVKLKSAQDRKLKEPEVKKEESESMEDVLKKNLSKMRRDLDEASKETNPDDDDDWK